MSFVIQNRPFKPLGDKEWQTCLYSSTKACAVVYNFLCKLFLYFKNIFSRSLKNTLCCSFRVPVKSCDIKKVLLCQDFHNLLFVNSTFNIKTINSKYASDSAHAKLLPNFSQYLPLFQKFQITYWFSWVEFRDQLTRVIEVEITEQRLE